jgi:hypothetical protein
MSAAQSIIEKIASLPADKQQEIFDFIEFIAIRHQKTTAKTSFQQEWSESTFAQFSMQQAMRGLEDESVIYTDDDLKEHWL